jgi:hypothetical protein
MSPESIVSVILSFINHEYRELLFKTFEKEKVFKRNTLKEEKNYQGANIKILNITNRD